MNLHEWQKRLRAFARERDWEGFHSPKNLATALSVEAAELLEHFQWLESEQSAQLDPATHEAVRLEMADVLLYLLRLADRLDIDLEQACADKFALNERRYPPDRCRGSAAKYTRYRQD